jgi:hypothetical protein
LITRLDRSGHWLRVPRIILSSIVECYEASQQNRQVRLGNISIDDIRMLGSQWYAGDDMGTPAPGKFFNEMSIGLRTDFSTDPAYHITTPNLDPMTAGSAQKLPEGLRLQPQSALSAPLAQTPVDIPSPLSTATASPSPPPPPPPSILKKPHSNANRIVKEEDEEPVIMTVSDPIWIMLC